MIRQIDELNTLKSMPPEKFFGDMDLTEEQERLRLEFTQKANEIFDVILVLLLTMRESGNIDYTYIYGMMESQYFSLINEYVVVDDYLMDYAMDYVNDFMEVTRERINEEWFTSADRALYNAENCANDVLNYKDYQEAIAKGMTHKKWVTERDNRVRKTHKEVEGKEIPIKDKFYVGGVPMRFPKDTEYAATAPWETINCRCQVKYTRKSYDS